MVTCFLLKISLQIFELLSEREYYELVFKVYIMQTLTMCLCIYCQTVIKFIQCIGHVEIFSFFSCTHFIFTNSCI